MLIYISRVFCPSHIQKNISYFYWWWWWWCSWMTSWLDCLLACEWERKIFQFKLSSCEWQHQKLELEPQQRVTRMIFNSIVRESVSHLLFRVKLIWNNVVINLYMNVLRHSTLTVFSHSRIVVNNIFSQFFFWLDDDGQLMYKHFSFMFAFIYLKNKKRHLLFLYIHKFFINIEFLC